MRPKNKILALASLKKTIARERSKGKTIAFTNGCFDILHYGHVSYLQAAKKNGRVLVIGLNSDASVKKIKGPQRPIIPERERAGILAALECVDYVTIFKEETPLNVIKALKPDVLIKGADWKGKEVVGSDIVKANGGKVELIRYMPNLSTTNIVKTVVKKCAG